MHNVVDVTANDVRYIKNVIDEIVVGSIDRFAFEVEQVEPDVRRNIFAVLTRLSLDEFAIG